jgi:uncharacterized protein YbjT (DUF2867 family)
MILITGATGTIGSHLLPILATRGEPVRAMARDTAKIAAGPGIDVVRADFSDAASLSRAVNGARAVFLLTAPPSPTAQHDLAMLTAAHAAGVSHVVKLSAIGTGEKNPDGTTVGAWHLQAEQALQASGIAWTLLRPSFFASNWLHQAAAIKAAEPVPNPTGASRQGVIDPRDVAAAAAEALTSPSHLRHIYTLTGPELISATDQATHLEQEIGYPVTVADVSIETTRAQLLASGTTSSAADAILAGPTWARAGNNAILTDDVAQILRRPATTFRSWAHDHRDAFAR